MMRFLLTVLLINIFTSSFAQLYMPRDVKKAYANGTRNLSGKPGKNYRQNHAVYDITLDIAPPSRIIKGTEKITYYNDSPDTLKTLFSKLLLNIHKPGAARNRRVSSEYLSQGIIVDAVTVNRNKINLPDAKNTGINLPLRLPKALPPHTSAELSIDWHFELSIESGREGMIDSTTYFLAYFYPRISVYDDYAGWDGMPFMDDHEFYSDFNDYTVTLNLPKNYIVWGTGTLQQPEKLLQPAFLQRYNESLLSDKTIRIITPADLTAKNITAQNSVNSWQFKAKDIPDMAFGISDHYVWDGCSAVVDDKTGRRAGAFAAYNDTAADYHSVAQYARHSLDWLSHNWPGVPYPYEKTTVFHGYAGMEYPMMANDETYTDTAFSRFVAEHEIAHTYMPFYMGINETRFGFMDEGWATTFEYLIGTHDLGKEKAIDFFKQFRVEGWINDPSADEDLPIITGADVLTGNGFGNNEYGKASLGYLAMKDMLGDAMFKKCLHAYMDRWHSKHPIPWDFFYSFNDVSGKDLNWFWNNWFFTNNYIDLSLKSVAKTGSGYKVTIDNIGGMAAPADILVTYSDGTTESFHQSSAIWEKDQRKAEVTIAAKKKIVTVRLDGNIFMDADYSNNLLKL